MMSVPGILRPLRSYSSLASHQTNDKRQKLLLSPATPKPTLPPCLLSAGHLQTLCNCLRYARGVMLGCLVHDTDAEDDVHGPHSADLQARPNEFSPGMKPQFWTLPYTHLRCPVLSAELPSSTMPGRRASSHAEAGVPRNRELPLVHPV